MRTNRHNIRKTYVAIVVDESGSMMSIRRDVVQNMNETFRTIQDKARDEETYVSLYTFASYVDRILDRVSSESAGLEWRDSSYNPGGMTALYDGVGRAIQDLQMAPDAAHPETSFLVIVLTDGGENASKSIRGPEFQRLLRETQRTDRWTYAFQCAPGDRRHIEALGVPSGNIREWQATSRGTIETRVATQSALGTYYSQRAAGVKSVQTFYVTPDMSKVPQRDVQSRLVDVRDRFKALQVPREAEIEPFVRSMLGTYQPGSAYYQLTKPELVQKHKNVLLMVKGEKAIYSGAEARDLVGLPPGGDAKVKPGNFANYDIFVQSTSVNRKLVRGTTLLVEKRS